MTANTSRLRRRLLVVVAAVAGTAGALYVLRRPLTRFAFATAVDNSGFDRTSRSFEDSARCGVTAQAVEGPFFVPDSPLRSDIRDGQQGHPLHLRLKLVDAENCQVIEGAAVHIWHANALGLYSGYASHNPDVVELTPGHEPVENRERYLRGHQITDEQGLVEYRTIMPAWYSFRTPHIHVKALLRDQTVLTTQLYFPDEINTHLLTTAQPYQRRPGPLVSNRSDPVIKASQGALGGWPKLSALEEGGGYAASLTLSVTRFE